MQYYIIYSVLSFCRPSPQVCVQEFYRASRVQNGQLVLASQNNKTQTYAYAYTNAVDAGQHMIMPPSAIPGNRDRECYLQFHTYICD